MATKTSDYVRLVLTYHEQTKHQLDRYARSLGYMDWANQPNPFRLYRGAPQIKLDHLEDTNSPPYDDLFNPGSIEASQLDKVTVSHLLFDSLALSAWKQTPGSNPWSLRVNPSSGNLHPTEAYLICGGLPGIAEEPGIYHYSPLTHALEKRAILTQEEWNNLATKCPSDTLFVVLTSIYWREAWKYGERAFRYCNHDVGHALGAITLAAAALGWSSRVVETVTDDELSQLLSLNQQDASEAERPDCLLVLSPSPSTTSVRVPQKLLERLSGVEFLGQANQLSQNHHPWPAIDQASSATEYRTAQLERDLGRSMSDETAHELTSSSSLPARTLFRRRRSAVAMDSSVSMSGSAFFQLLGRLALNRNTMPFDLFPWSPHVSLVFFVHRVTDLEEGIYLLVRSPEHFSSLRDHLRADFLWRKPANCPEDVGFYLLEEGDCRDSARIVSCHQSIAADGVLSLGMLAHFEPVLRDHGPWYYKRLHWECGLIGQILYLEAEAAGISGTGIGCFHDDVLHQLLGLEDRTWQTLYHFTVGKALEDFRLQTIPAYHHL